jgi:hypothetical protein
VVTSSGHSRSAIGRFASDLGLRWRRAGLAGRIVTVGSGVVVLALIVTGVAFGLSGGPASHAAADPTTTAATTGSSSTSTATTRPNAKSKFCPLTGRLPASGKVPQRPALAVKIGNDPASRPQSGLLDADIVYEEMAEGGITRYMAVFQCTVPAMVGPIRSVRWDDWHVLQSYGHPILSFSGGIDQWDAAVASLSWLFDANGSEGATVSAYFRTSNREAPWNYYSTGKALWGLDPRNHTTPPAQFTYSHAPAAGAVAATGATIVGFATGADVDWQWSSRLQTWLRSYDGVPDNDISGAQLHATNVVIEEVVTKPGPYAESGTVPDVESLTQGSGPAFILRNGKVEKGTWNCAAYGDITKYRFSNGTTMTLAPGTTWVEVVPDQGYPVQIHA